tara:strand:+ start:716 stop:1165 length:450 start_codon:yes stop_codon:yes gene_type:complete
MAEDVVAFDKAELRSIIYAFKGMDDEAVTKAKSVSNGLATYLQGRITSKSQGRDKASIRVAEGSRVSKSSKIGEMSFGFASQKFSGGATTQQLWGGYEFGSNKYKQFPIWSGREGRGSKGWFIYPTLKAEQPHIISQWQDAFSQIVKVW